MKEVNENTVKYGELLEVASLTGDKNNPRDFKHGYHTGMKVHYFNKKGVFLGNIYEFVPYKYVRFRKDAHVWPRHFMIKNNGKYRSKMCEWLLHTIYTFKCWVVTILIRNTYHD